VICSHFAVYMSKQSGKAVTDSQGNLLEIEQLFRTGFSTFVHIFLSYDTIKRSCTAAYSTKTATTPKS